MILLVPDRIASAILHKRIHEQRANLKHEYFSMDMLIGAVLGLGPYYKLVTGDRDETVVREAMESLFSAPHFQNRLYPAVIIARGWQDQQEILSDYDVIWYGTLDQSDDRVGSVRIKETMSLPILESYMFGGTSYDF